jgi:hypothetical protein
LAEEDVWVGQSWCRRWWREKEEGKVRCISLQCLAKSPQARGRLTSRSVAVQTRQPPPSSSPLLKNPSPDSTPLRLLTSLPLTPPPSQPRALPPNLDPNFLLPLSINTGSPWTRPTSLSRSSPSHLSLLHLLLLSIPHRHLCSSRHAVVSSLRPLDPLSNVRFRPNLQVHSRSLRAVL